MSALWQWMVKSTAFRKASGMIGGFGAGMWVSWMYWRQINATLEVWGVSRERWLAALFALASFGLSALSLSLTAAKKKTDKVAKVQEGAS